MRITDCDYCGGDSRYCGCQEPVNPKDAKAEADLLRERVKAGRLENPPRGVEPVSEKPECLLKQLANARLIAAAPELLSTLKRVLAGELDKLHPMDEVRAVIAKAEGKTP